MRNQDYVQLQQIALDVIRYRSNFRFDHSLVNLANVHVQAMVEDVTQQLVLQLNAHIAAQHLETIMFKKPATWWEHLKEAKAPEWFLKRYPVKYVAETYEVKALYPDMLVPEHRSHIVVHKIG